MNSLRYPRSAAVYGIDERADEVQHFGMPLKEQRDLAAGRAVADLSSFRVYTLTGEDCLRWLHSLTTQSLENLPAGTSTETLILSATGHIEHWVRIIAEEDSLWLIFETGGEEAVEWLNSMRFMMRAEITDRTLEFQCVGTVGPAPEGLPVQAEWNDPWPAIGAGSASYAALDLGQEQASPKHPGRTHDLRIQLCPRDQLRDWQPGGVAGRDAWEALRIENWRPSPQDVDSKTLVGELDVLRTAVHLAKGCYRGQEAVARVHNLGQVPRRLVFLHVDGSTHTIPRPGAEVYAEVRGAERVIGHLTSTAIHYEYGPVALALIRRGTSPDAQLLVAGDEDEKLPTTVDEIVAFKRENRVGLPQINREADLRRLGR